MHVGLDISCTARSRVLGVGRYAIDLVSALDRSTDARCTLLYGLSRLRRRRHLMPAPSSRVRRRPFTESLARWQLARYDVVHGLDARIPRCPTPTVATIHDLFSLQHTDFASEEFRRTKIARYEQIAEEATRIVVFTEKLRRDIEDSFPAAKGRVRVVRPGIDSQFAEVDDARTRECRAAHGLSRPYVLFLGPLSHRKNCVRMIEAFDRLADDFPEHELIFGGEPSLGADAIRRAIDSARGRERIRVLGYLPWRDLPGVYAGADAFLFTTLAEGFGFPILEAQAAGTRVLASDQAVPREVGGEAAAFAPPDSVEGIEAGLRALLGEDASTRAERIRQGRQRATRFTWPRCAAGTLEVYREAAGT